MNIFTFIMSEMMYIIDHPIHYCNKTIIVTN